MKPFCYFAFASVLIVAVLYLTGCATNTYGTKLDQNKVSQIKKGVTTRVEVVAVFGPPVTVSMLGDGRRMMFYSYFDRSAQPNAVAFIPLVGIIAGKASGQTRNQTLQIILNTNDIVEDYEFSDQTREFESGAFGSRSAPSTPVAPQSK